MPILRRLLKYPLANAAGYYLLRKQAKACHWLMGIGSGSSVHDSGEAAVVKRLVRRDLNDLTIIDAGANQGQFLGLVSERLGPRIREIHCFEPAAATFQALQENAPNLDGLSLNNFALGEQPGTAELYYDKEKSGAASLTRRDLSFRNISFDQHETIRITTLDSYCAEQSIEHIDWLKIDVEGHELDVLKGASGLLDRKAVKHVTFEFGGCNVDTRTFFRDFFDFFKAHGMRIFRITPGGYFHPIKRYRESDEQFETINYVATLDESW